LSEHPGAHDLVEGVVWEAVCRLLAHPSARGGISPAATRPTAWFQWETPESLRVQSSKLRQGIARLIDSYAEGVLGRKSSNPGSCA